MKPVYFITALMFGSLSLISKAHAQLNYVSNGGSTINSYFGCSAASSFLAVAQIYTLEYPADGAEILKQLRGVKSRACRGEFESGSTITYPNGHTATSYAGDPNATWYWPNGRVITNYALSPSALVNYPNGRTISAFFRQGDSTFYYPSGQHMSISAGQKGSTIYDSSGRTLSGNSPSFIYNSLLDVEKFLNYVVELNGSNNDSEISTADCSATALKTHVDLSIELLRSHSDMAALKEMMAVKACLKD
jgi:hypothetical protein